MKKIKYILMFLGVIAFIGCYKQSVCAAEMSENPMVMVEKYEVSKEKIVPGEEFELTLFLKNFSDEQTAKNIVIDIVNPSGVVPAYGTVSQIYIGDLAAGETKEVTMSYYADTLIESVSVDFSLTIISSGSAMNYISLRVPVGTDVPFYILSERFPESAKVGENVTASLSFEVIGDAEVGNVEHVVLVNGEPYGSSTIGTLAPGATRTQSTTVLFWQAGEYKVDVEMQYIDKTGESKAYTVSSKTITISDVEKNEFVAQDDIYTENESNTMLILCLGGIVLLALLLIFVIVRNKK